ncbi:MAG: 3-dehydroquinate synthase [Halanaerobiales bacterium]
MTNEYEVINIHPQTINNAYRILIGSGIRKELAKHINNVYEGDKILIVTDANVHRLYAGEILTVLNQEGFDCEFYVLPAGEEAKSSVFLEMGYDRLVAGNYQRQHLILALGGGVVGDLAGYLAATYMRGIPYVQVPTTLLAQVDSSVGGKTAINHEQGKNLIGSFYQPQMVIIDVDFLDTLPMRELKTGMAEVIKYGFIMDKDFFVYLEENKNGIMNLNRQYLIHIVKKSCALKAEIVEKDEREAGIRALLNFGHTIAHGIEAATSYGKYTHGEAVAIGMRGGLQLAEMEGHLKKEEELRGEAILDSYSLASCFEEDIENIHRAMQHDKKVRNNQLRWILLREIGEAFITGGIEEVTVNKILEGLKCRK